MEELRPATREDYTALYGEPPSATFTGLTAVRDGRPIAIAGVLLRAGTAVMFSDLREPVAKRTVVKAARQLFAWAKARNIRVVAARDATIPTSAGLLAHFGFTQCGTDGEVYQWLPH